MGSCNELPSFSMSQECPRGLDLRGEVYALLQLWKSRVNGCQSGCRMRRQSCWGTPMQSAK